MSYFCAADNNYMETDYTGKPSLITVTAWAKVGTWLQDRIGAVLASPTTGGQRGYWEFQVRCGTTSGKSSPAFFADWTTQFAYNVPNNSNVNDMSAWSLICATYDGSSTSNEPALYCNSSTAFSSSGQGGGGTLVTTSNVWSLFRRAMSSQLLDAYLAHVAIFDRVLTTGQIGQLVAGRNPMDTTNVGANPVWYNMMTNGLGTNDSGGSSGLSGGSSSVRNAQVGTLTNFSAALFNSDNPTVDSPPFIAGGATIQVNAQYFRRIREG